MAELNVGNHVIFTLTPQEGAALLRTGSLVVVAPAPNRDDERMPAKATAPLFMYEFPECYVLSIERGPTACALVCVADLSAVGNTGYWSIKFECLRRRAAMPAAKGEGQ